MRPDLGQPLRLIETVAARLKREARGEAGLRHELRHCSPAVNCIRSGNPQVGEDTVALRTGRSRLFFACVLIQLTAAVAGCSEIGFGRQSEKAVDPNKFPENYKKDLLAYVQAHPAEFLNARDASISAPALRPVGTENRYFVCLRANAPDWRKEKVVMFFAGRINQFVDAEGDSCSTALYQPFPELVAEVSELKGKK